MKMETRDAVMLWRGHSLASLLPIKMYDFTENNSGGILFVASKKTPCFMYTAEEKYANVNTWEQ